MMVGEVASTLEVNPLGSMRVHINWVSDSNGDVSAWLEGIERPYSVGGIERIVTRPSTAAAPSANYDISIEDERGETIAQAANRSATAVETNWPYELHGTLSHSDKCTYTKMRFVVANAGNTKAGEAEIYVTPLPG